MGREVFGRSRDDNCQDKCSTDECPTSTPGRSSTNSILRRVQMPFSCRYGQDKEAAANFYPTAAFQPWPWESPLERADSRKKRLGAGNLPIGGRSRTGNRRREIHRKYACRMPPSGRPPFASRQPVPLSFSRSEE